MQKHISWKAFNTLQQPTQTHQKTKQHITLASIHPHGLLSKPTLAVLFTERHSYCRVQRNEEGGGGQKKRE